MKRKRLRVPIEQQRSLPVSEGDLIGGIAILDANGDVVDRYMLDTPFAVTGGDSFNITYNFWNWDDIKP